MEAVIFAEAPGEPCYVTQAGSNLRTLQHSILGDWSCAVSARPDGGHGAAWARGSATSAFGTDAV
eukprot:14798710-Heterocapsa_arctica.AAC.1